jgi:hypothetical protein
VASKTGAQSGHEGAKESTAPGTPRERDVITPDWAHLEKDTPGQCVPDGESRDDSSADRGSARPIKGPAIDRHR